MCSPDASLGADVQMLVFAYRQGWAFACVCSRRPVLPMIVAAGSCNIVGCEMCWMDTLITDRASLGQLRVWSVPTVRLGSASELHFG